MIYKVMGTRQFKEVVKKLHGITSGFYYYVKFLDIKYQKINWSS